MENETKLGRYIINKHGHTAVYLGCLKNIHTLRRSNMRGILSPVADMYFQKDDWKTFEGTTKEWESAKYNDSYTRR